MSRAAGEIAGFPDHPTFEDVHKPTPINSFKESPLYERWHRQVVQSDNDFVIVIAAASKSAMSGVGKTTLGIGMSRWFDLTDGGFSAEQKATLSAHEFARELLANRERVQHQSSIIFDEGQGTLAESGADARRSMAQSVMDVTTALSTMRFRQLTSIIITQSTKWIDKRVDEVMDAMVLIQDSSGGTIRAEVFDTYYNDLDEQNTRYVEHLDTITWPKIPKEDPDYSHLHELKEKSATNNLDEEGEEDDQELLKEQQIQLAQHLRDSGQTIAEIAENPLITYSVGWISNHTEAESDD